MRKLFLASSFRTLLADKKLKSELMKFLPKKPKDILIGHIPNAGDVEDDISYIKESTDQLLAMGMKIKKIDLREEKTNSLRKKLADCDVIFVNGGNTFYLLDIIHKSGFDKVLPELLDAGKIYISASAGSYIACPTIEQAGWKHTDPDKNVVGLKDLTAMKLVPFIITAHYNRENYQGRSVEQEIVKTKYPVVALYDTQAVKVEGDKYQVVGDGKREFFNGFEERI
jgi:dipeptidase E